MSKHNDRRRRRGHRQAHDAPFNPTTSGAERKLAQLCRQVHERIDLVLAGELRDPNLEGLWVLDVQPEAGSSALLVTLVIPDEADRRAVERSIDAAHGRLRTEVAAAITRKRTPHLRFALLPSRALRGPGGEREPSAS